MPEFFNLLAMGSLGMLLTRNLGDQLGANLQITSRAGTRFEIEFEKADVRGASSSIGEYPDT